MLSPAEQSAAVAKPASSALGTAWRSAHSSATFNASTDSPDRALASAGDSLCSLASVSARRWLSGNPPTAPRNHRAAKRSAPSPATR